MGHDQRFATRAKGTSFVRRQRSADTDGLIASKWPSDMAARDRRSGNCAGTKGSSDRGWRVGGRLSVNKFVVWESRARTKTNKKRQIASWFTIIMLPADRSPFSIESPSPRGVLRFDRVGTGTCSISAVRHRHCEQVKLKFSTG